MDHTTHIAPRFDWEILSDAVGGLSLAVLFMAAMTLPLLF